MQKIMKIYNNLVKVQNIMKRETIFNKNKYLKAKMQHK